MGCFSLDWIEQTLVFLVIICATIAVLKLVIPWVLSVAGLAIPAILWQIINIVIWAVVAIYVIYIVFFLISCLLGAGGGHHLLPR